MMENFFFVPFDWLYGWLSGKIFPLDFSVDEMIQLGGNRSAELLFIRKRYFCFHRLFVFKLRLGQKGLLLLPPFIRF